VLRGSWHKAEVNQEAIMDATRFDALVRGLGRAATRRGVLASAAGVLGLHGAGVAARRQRGATKRQGGAVAAQALTGIEVGCPEYPPESLAVLSAFYPGYWWDHTNLTVAVQAHPKADPKLVAAAREAITIWNDVLADDPDLRRIELTLTDVTDTLRPAHKADIVLHYVPRAGGTVFGGYAICGNHKCNNVIVRSDLPKPLGRDPYTPEYLGWVTLHELGHALGLGHAEPLEDNTDLMGYGWPDLGDPVLSECDLRTLKVVFAWKLNGDDPHPPTVDSVSCSGLCGVP
jgi:hypothetical protein